METFLIHTNLNEVVLICSNLIEVVEIYLTGSNFI